MNTQEDRNNDENSVIDDEIRVRNGMFEYELDYSYLNSCSFNEEKQNFEDTIEDISQIDGELNQSVHSSVLMHDDMLNIDLIEILASR